MGTNNSIQNLTYDCDGYDGRGLFLQDQYSWIENCRVIDSPARPFSLNGGGNASYGLDTNGWTEDDGGWDSTPVFYPYGCKILNCYTYNAGQTAYSQKRMRYSEIRGNYAELVYSEGITSDVKGDYSVVAFNTLKNIARTDSATAFEDKEDPGNYLSVGIGGTGAIGVDNNYYTKIIGNSVIGVQENETAGSKIKAAFNFVNNIGPSYGIVVQGNHFENADVGVLFKGTGDGAADNTYNSIVSGNTFVDVLTEVQIQAGSTNNKVIDNVANTEAGLVILENSTDNFITDTGYSNDLTIEGGSSAGTGTYATNGQRIAWERRGKIVSFTIYLEWTAHDGTGLMQVQGLPFTSDAVANNSAAFACSCTDMTVTGPLFMQIAPGTDYGSFFQVNDGTRSNKDVEATGTVYVSGSYFAE
jgi:hypothetical protein